MDAKLKSLLFVALLALPSCSKWSRLEKSLTGKAQVSFNATRERSHGLRGPAGGFSMLSTPQDGGVIIWAHNQLTHESASVILIDELDDVTMTLDYGAWDFHAIGFDGNSSDYIFESSAQCGSTLGQNISPSSTHVNISISLSGCNPGTANFFGDFSLKPMRFITCASLPSTFDGGTTCSGNQIGDLKSLEVVAHSYNQTDDLDSPISTEERHSQCKDFPSTGTVASLVSPFILPEGESGFSPIYFTVNAYTGFGCSGTEVSYEFKNGLQNGAENGAAVYKTHFSPFNTNNALFLVHGVTPAPAISSVSPTSGGWGGVQTMTVHGSHFDSNSVIKIDGVTCTTTFDSSTQVHCTPSATSTLGARVVRVENSDGQVSGTGTYTIVDDGFGKGAEGNLSITTSFSVTAASTLGSRSFHSYFNVSNIATTTSVGVVAGRTLTVVEPITAADIGTGDTVLWHVSAFSSLSGCSPSSDLGLGEYDVSLVTSVDYVAQKITLMDVVSSDPNNAGLAESSRVHGNVFCVMQLVRIPSFFNLSMSASTSPTVTVPPFDLTQGKGGILAMQVLGTMTVSGAGVASLDVSGKGFAGGLGVASSIGHPGLGWGGTAAVDATSPNANGGGGGDTSPAGAGGGGNFGGGGAGGFNASSGGDPVGTCDPMSNCALFGGGGGAGPSAAADGGNGGGIALIFARSLSSASNNFSVVSTGTNAAGTNSGGGAGGTVFLRTLDASGSTFNLTANGGDGASGTAAGGGGGGGVARNAGCSGVSGAATFNVVGGTASGSGSPAPGSAGDSSATGSASGSDFCP